MRLLGFEPKSRTWKDRMLPLHHKRKIDVGGLEPPTPAVSEQCANQLRYTSIIHVYSSLSM